MYFFLKYIVTLFYKKLRIKMIVCLLRESGPRLSSDCLLWVCLLGRRDSTKNNIKDNIKYKKINIIFLKKLINNVFIVYVFFNLQF